MRNGLVIYKSFLQKKDSHNFSYNFDEFQQSTL